MNDTQVHADEDWAIDLHLFWIAIQLSHFADEFATSRLTGLQTYMRYDSSRARMLLYPDPGRARPRARAGKDNDVMRVMFCLAC